jgi:AcrR family transcriptional regulator
MDRRTQKTQNAIRKAFLTLLEEKSISKITIAEISELADLGRGTFYLHYKDIYDLYEQIENSLYMEIELMLDELYTSNAPENLINITHAITEYINKNRHTFLLIIGAGSNGRSLYKLKNILNKKVIFENPNLYPSDYHIINCMFATSGVIGVLEEWLFNRQKLSQKKISESLFKILQRFEW